MGPCAFLSNFKFEAEGNFTAMNEVYGEYFDDQPPARACVEVSRLPKDVLVEIECIAVK